MYASGSTTAAGSSPLESGTQPYLTFTVGHETYGVPRPCVCNVVACGKARMQPLPTPPRNITGTNRSAHNEEPGDRAIPVVDIHCGGHERTPESTAAPIGIVLGRETGQVGILAASLDGTIDVPRTDAQAIPHLHEATEDPRVAAIARRPEHQN